MNVESTHLFDTNEAVEKALDDASRYWRKEYYQMTVSQVAAERRDRTIKAVAQAIAENAEEPLKATDHHTAQKHRESASLKVGY